MKEITRESLLEYGFLKYNSWSDDMYFKVCDVGGVELNINYGTSSNDGFEDKNSVHFEISQWDDFILDYKYIEQIDGLVKALTGKI